MSVIPVNPQIVKPLIEAIKREDVESIARLFELDPEQKHAHTFFGGSTWLGYAAGQGKLQAVKALVSFGVDVNQGSSRENVAPICNAAGNGHFEIVEYLLASGSRLDITASVVNPLIWAVTDWHRAKDTTIVKLLLKAGIDSVVEYPYSGRTKTKKPLNAISKSLLWGTPIKAGTIAAWNAAGNYDRARELLEAAMVAAGTHVVRNRCGKEKLAEMQRKEEQSLQKALDAALNAEF